MKMMQIVLFSLLMGIAVAAHALDQDVQVDLLMAKITNALKANRAVDALPSFAQLESMEPSLKKPLSESFHYFYIDTLDKSGNHPKALSRANVYMEKFGKRGKHYGEVIEIMSRLQDEADKQAKQAADEAIRMADRKRAYKEQHDKWEMKVDKCYDSMQAKHDRLGTLYGQRRLDEQDAEELKRLDRIENTEFYVNGSKEWGYRGYCMKQYPEPVEPR